MADFICAEIDQRSGAGCPFLSLAVTAAAVALSVTRIAARKASASMARVMLPVPAVPGADLVIRQADFLLGDLEAFLDGPAPSGDAGEGGQAGVGRAEDDVIGELVRLVRMATHEQPVVSQGGCCRRIRRTRAQS